MMLLAIDIGNTHLHGALFQGDELVFQFRKHTQAASSDEIGVFLRGVLKENQLNYEAIKYIIFCSVVPDLSYSFRSACIKYFSIEPLILQVGVKTGIKIKYHNPTEVGADRIANAVGAVFLFPHQDLIILDFGTATTLCVVTKDKEYLGGLILPGIRTAMEALELKAAKLPKVELAKPSHLIGKSTTENIQSGLFYGALYGLQGAIQEIERKEFSNQKLRILGTGGFGRLFEGQDLFQDFVPELTLLGLREIWKANTRMIG